MKETKQTGYVSPEIEIICFNTDDIITTSSQYSPGPDSSDTDYEGGVDW